VGPLFPSMMLLWTSPCEDFLLQVCRRPDACYSCGSPFSPGQNRYMAFGRGFCSCACRDAEITDGPPTPTAALGGSYFAPAGEARSSADMSDDGFAAALPEVHCEGLDDMIAPSTEPDFPCDCKETCGGRDNEAGECIGFTRIFTLPPVDPVPSTDEVRCSQASCDEMSPQGLCKTIYSRKARLSRSDDGEDAYDPIKENDNPQGVLRFTPQSSAAGYTNARWHPADSSDALGYSRS